MSAALVPVKSLAATKSRLAAVLPRAELARLSLAMLQDVVAALRAAPSVSRVAVVTPDADVAEAARSCGAEPLLCAEAGLNPSLDAGTRALRLAVDAPLLVVLGDVAGARSQDVEALFAALREEGGRGVVLAPSRDGGTSALLRAPAGAIPARFGPESAKAHREAAARQGLPLRELALPSLALDLDRAEDLDRFLAACEGGDRTRALLRELGWGRSS
jgi:2-phospho-L-lactate guanylyltransferase